VKQRCNERGSKLFSSRLPLLFSCPLSRASCHQRRGAKPNVNMEGGVFSAGLSFFPPPPFLFLLLLPPPPLWAENNRHLEGVEDGEMKKPLFFFFSPLLFFPPPLPHLRKRARPVSTERATAILRSLGQMTFFPPFPPFFLFPPAATHSGTGA